MKIDKFKPEYLGQLEFYLEALDRDVRKAHENPSIGVLLCRDKDDEVVEYALSRSLSPTVIAEYETGLHEDYLIKVPGWIVAESKRYGYDPMFITALIITESSFYNWAHSHKGAVGLMQIKPRTGAAMASEVKLEWKGTPTLYDPGSNIALGAYYLNKMIMQYGDLQLALEAYNHGPSGLNRILRKGRIPKKYSGKVFSNYAKIISTSSTT